jgi:hypothetical protein
MNKDGANWNTKYIVNPIGRAFKIKDLSLKQTNNSIGRCHGRMRTDKVNLESLYQRRAILLGEPIESGKTRRKVMSNLNFVDIEPMESDEAERIKAIVLMALKHLQNGADVSLIEAILKQARDKDD